MPSYLNENLAAVARRWPWVEQELARANALETFLVSDGPQATLLVEGIHLSSCYDRRAEACVQASLVPESCTEAWVYGVGLGDLPRELLARPQLRCLHVVLLNPAVVLASFEHVNHCDWLADSRVNLLTATSQSGVRAPTRN